MRPACLVIERPVRLGRWRDTAGWLGTSLLVSGYDRGSGTEITGSDQ
jgi:hypothetical protein